ncbi:g10497 [Coccomyxa viridis]|uniref:G10497 protein n=1 Tax=Coccomyxa viridis TaxID=1274662 RepID=A0ABP1G6U3_9CHLO
MSTSVTIKVQAIGGRPSALTVPVDIKVEQLKQIISSELRFPLDRLKLVKGGKPLDDDLRAAGLSDGDTLLAVIPPRPPPKHLHSACDSSAGEPGSWDDPARFRLPTNASATKKRLAAFLKQRLRIPDVALIILFNVRPWAWAVLAAWLMGAPLASRLEVGPLYVLVSIVAVIYWNLGTRREGDASAYSIFNGFRELPGQLNAGALDEQIRRGQMG